MTLLISILGLILILSALGVILAKKPVHSCLYFFLTLLALATLYIELGTEFIGLIQILVYGGAILVLFMFVIILFQDAHEQIKDYSPLSSKLLLVFGAVSLFTIFSILALKLFGLESASAHVPQGFGSIQSIGKVLYIDYFFPFEAAVVLILVALIGALYIGKKV